MSVNNDLINIKENQISLKAPGLVKKYYGSDKV